MKSNCFILLKFRFIYFLFAFTLISSNRCFSQDTILNKEIRNNLGLFGKLTGINVTVGLTASGFGSTTGTYVYILNQNATVTERTDGQWGSSLSMNIVVSPLNNATWAFILNIPLKDIKSVSTGSDGFFNSQTPFGVGAALFPFKNFKVFGLSLMVNFGQVSRMYPENISNNNPNNNTYFPIANYPYWGLKVGAPVPSGLLDPYSRKVATISGNIGITLRL